MNGKQHIIHKPRKEKVKLPFKKKLLRAAIHFLATMGIAVIYYVLFSFLVDTPLEYEMKISTRKLNEEYIKLSQRYDSLERVLDNVVDRDRSVFRSIFESYPYELGDDYEKKRADIYENLLSKNKKQLESEFYSKLGSLEKRAGLTMREMNKLTVNADSLRQILNTIPAIQPVINPDLTLLTASYGMLIHPFYKTLSPHQGVDFTVGEGSSVFATADGRVKDLITRQTSSGTTVTIDHGLGYETTYSHLGKVNVRKGQTVRRGDIIAQSGNTGLSLAPHLHYEIKLNGMRIDPVHFFFMELGYEDYQKIISIAQSVMQSFD